MFYRDLNDIRQRSNVLGVILNRATNSGRRPLPEQFADIRREWDELTDIWHQPALIKDGVEIAEANLEDIKYEDNRTVGYSLRLRGHRSHNEKA